MPRKIEQRAQMILQYVNSGKEERNKQPVIGQSHAPGDNGLFHDGQTLDDERLVEAAKIGHKAAFDELSRRHAKKIFHVAHRITRNREDAEDVVQESFVRAFIHLKSFDGRSQFSTWLTRIAINSAVMSLRKNRRSREVPMEERIEPSEPWHQQFADPDPSLNQEKRFAKHERETILRRAISRLRPRMREVVEIRLQEYSLNDTANALGISLAAAKGRLFHARGMLRRAMKSAVSSGRISSVDDRPASRHSGLLTKDTRKLPRALAVETGFGARERMRRAFVRTHGEAPQAIRSEAGLIASV